MQVWKLVGRQWVFAGNGDKHGLYVRAARLDRQRYERRARRKEGERAQHRLPFAVVPAKEASFEQSSRASRGELTERAAEENRATELVQAPAVDGPVHSPSFEPRDLGPGEL